MSETDPETDPNTFHPMASPVGKRGVIAHAHPANASVPRRVFAGLQHLVWGIKTSLTTPSLLMLSTGIVAANFIVYAILFYIGYIYSDDVAGYLAAMAPSVFRWSWKEAALRVLVMVLWAIACVFLAIFIASVLTGPLLDQLSERTEQLLTGEVYPLPFELWPIAYEIVAGLVFTILSLVLGLTATLLLFWVPIIGQFVPLAVSALFVALSFVAPTAIRHRLTMRQRLAVVRNNKALLLGFGMPASIFPMLLVPLLTPALVVGGTRLFLSLAATGRVETQASASQVARILGE